MQSHPDTSAGAGPGRAARLARLRYRAAHRGFLEADLILGPFAERHGGDLDDAELDALEVLLDQPDHDIYAWIVGQTATPAAFETAVMGRLRAFRDQAHRVRRELGVQALGGARET